MKKLFTLFLIVFQIILSKNVGCQYYNWPQFGFNGEYTSCNSDETSIHSSNVTQLKKVWGLGCDDFMPDSYSGSPVVFNGKIYVMGSFHEGIKCLNARKGTLIWESDDETEISGEQLAISKDSMLLYFEGSTPHLNAVTADSGKFLWSSDIGFDFYNNPLLTIDETRGLIYFIEDGSDNKLYAIDKSDGDVEWYISSSKDDIDVYGNHVLLKNDRIYLSARKSSQPFDAPAMVSFDPAVPDIDMTYELPDYADFVTDIEHYTICDDMLIVSYDNYTEDDRLIAGYNINDTSIVWETLIPQNITGEIACDPEEGIVYIPTNPYLYALDADNGDELWKYTGYDDIYSPSVANGIVYFISDNNMYAIDEATGIKLFNYNIGNYGELSDQVVISNGLIYFNGCGEGCGMYALGFNNPPVLESISDQITDEDVSLQMNGIEVSDDYYQPDELYGELTWNNVSLIPEENVTFHNGASGFSIALTPEENQYGVAEFIIYITDGTYIVSDTFKVTVSPVNDAPYIGEIPDQETYMNVPLNYISFVITDIETDSDELMVTASSDNQDLISDESIAIDCDESFCSLSLNPEHNKWGEAEITVQVSDGGLASTEKFKITVTPLTDIQPLSYQSGIDVTPNPFTDHLNIHIDLKNQGETEIKIYNMLGMEVANVMNGLLKEGSHDFTWFASGLEEGLYYCRIKIDDRIITRKVLLTK